ncbi:hypothetical protein ACU6T4_10845 [Avibacterium paragallinarum]|uniref:hypothetical protein n=1 Tax=Avibacterium paragallinarum TaxID=728 RepID=UPI00021ACF4E|nr:hypothetical protein [Avibacterium paragallinarum]AZI13293.1 hypothetical protein EIA51_00720 [Avibacterium paragallinarum]QIR12757.1 hypothetical protein HBL79_11375 [Avibacterium paragallinarum]QJE10711.1 hypothetical protein HHJ62_10690 [Avibacterium paragallinarum]QJE12904.1 hypothetical protein HHJ61_10690 [Avibacterium paragallinarum]QJE15107.1 hypothetical protein HHJ60_10720 [Avibacterium paragallinarum]
MLQPLQKNETFIQLKTEYQQELEEFNKVLDKIKDLEKKVERNATIIQALTTENSELEEKLDNGVENDNGDLDFSAFDKISDQLNTNTRKIATLEKLNQKTRDEIEIIKLDEYSKLGSQLASKYRKLHSYAYEFALNVMQDDNFIATLNFLCGIYAEQLDYIDKNQLCTFNLSIEKVFLEDFSRKIKPLVEPPQNSPLEVNKPCFSYPLRPKGFFAQQRLEELKQRQ